MSRLLAPNLVEYADFATPAHCALLIAAYERLVASEAPIVGDSFWDRRMVYYHSFVEHEPEAALILHDWAARTLAIVQSFNERRIYNDTAHVVRWTHESLNPHQDNQEPDGSPNTTPWRDWSGVIYLNDGYEGGEIWFPDHDISCKPATGSFISFPAHYRHGVRETRGAARYTAPGWYTFDPARECL